MIPKQTILELLNSARIQTGAKRIITEDVEALEDSPVHVVTGCKNCPLISAIHLNSGNNLVSCKHPKSDGYDYFSYPELHATCPLKTNSITIQLAKL